MFLLLSTVVHAAVLIRFGATTVNDKDTHAVSHSLEVELVSMTVDPVAEAPAVEPQVTHEPPAPPQTRTTETPPQPISKTTPTAEKTRAVSDAEPPVDEPQRETSTEPTSRTTTTQTPAAEPSPTAAEIANEAAARATLDSEKQRFLRRVAEHLERHKYYPRSARRRHIEGEVRVSFHLQANGDISELNIASGHRSLQDAVRESIDSALPLPTIPQDLRSGRGMNISYEMQFSLQD